MQRLFEGGIYRDWRARAHTTSIISLFVCIYNACAHTHNVVDPIPCGGISRAAFMGTSWLNVRRDFEGGRISRCGEISRKYGTCTFWQSPPNWELSHSLSVSSNHSISSTQTWCMDPGLPPLPLPLPVCCRWLARERYVPSTTSLSTSTGAPVTRLVDRLTVSKLSRTCRGRYRGLERKMVLIVTADV